MGKPPTPAPTDAPDACALIPDEGDQVLAIGLTERVDPANAPAPANDSERLLFRHLYETLVDVDCEGRVRPGLAASWTRDAAASRWMLTLRDAAQFTDGSSVTAADVVASWTRSAAGDLRPRVDRYVQAVVPIDDRTLAVTLRGDHPDAPVTLADAALAIVKRAPGAPWPLGTRRLGVPANQAAPLPRGRSVVTLTPVAAASPGSDAPQSALRFVIDPDRDGRDLLDGGIDLLMTRDPATADYAATLPAFVSLPLAWSRTRVFVSPVRSAQAPAPPPELRQALAADAVRGEARAAEGPFWWRATPDCAVAGPPSTAPVRASDRIVYEQGDEASKDLAERLAGRSAILDSLLPGRRAGRAAGLSPDALAAALQQGTEVGYVVAFDRVPLGPCEERRALADRIRWLDLDAIAPLADTRLRALVRRGHGGLTAARDGIVFVSPPGARR